MLCDFDLFFFQRDHAERKIIFGNHLKGLFILCLTLFLKFPFFSSIQAEREPPTLPQKVYYYNFADIRNDLRLPLGCSPWTLLQNSSDTIEVGLPSDWGWTIVVTFSAGTATTANEKVILSNFI